MLSHWGSLLLIGLAVVFFDLLLLGVTTPHWSFDVLIGVVIVYATAWFASRVWLARRFAQEADRDPASADVGELVDLPTQAKALEVLEHMLMPAGSQDGRIVSLKGPWGAGKTTLLRRLQRKLSQGETHVPVWINVWKAETEIELHRAFFERLLYTQAVFDACWLSFPWIAPRFSLLLRRLVRSVRLAFKNHGIEAEATLQADLPMVLTVQSQIEWIVNRMRCRDKALVVILEELDRATPAVAKLAVTASQRSFNLPGVTVVLPYVQEHLWTKVFNPLDPAPADLDSTIDALLHKDFAVEETKRKLLPANAGQSEEAPPSAEHLGLYAASPVASAQEANSPRPLDPNAPLAVWRRYRLHRHFAQLRASRQENLLRRFAEKYLGGYQVEIRGYAATDIARLVSEKDSLFLSSRSAFPALAAAKESDAREAIRAAFEKYHKNLKVAQLRHFEHYFLRLLALNPAEIADVPERRRESRCVAASHAVDQQFATDEARNEAMAKLTQQLIREEEQWPLRCAARALAALAALAAWYVEMMMEDQET